MGKTSTGQDNPEDLIDNTDQVGKNASDTEENKYAGRNENKAVNKLAIKGRSSPSQKQRQKWLREIAKTAASARWQRGD